MGALYSAAFMDHMTPPPPRVRTSQRTLCLIDRSRTGQLVHFRHEYILLSRYRMENISLHVILSSHIRFRCFAIHSSLKSPTMGKSKETSFRLCIAFLFTIQAACWALTLLDLLQPGKPLSLFRTSVSVYQNSTALVSQMFSRRAPSAVLYYKDIRARF